jgi:ribosomal protein L16 Arg81 hydroxylase
MSLQLLFGDLSLHQFVAEYFQRLPYSAAGQAASLGELGSWESLVGILQAEDADVLVCRRSEQYGGAVPRGTEEAQKLVEEGYTLLVRHAERHDPRLAALASEFEAAFAAPVNIHMYCTPGGQYGFGWHYDAEEVFIIQTTGRKEYRLRKNTVNPWPIEETLPADMRYEREIMPLMRCELAAGDWLYIPSGYWHMGESKETALSLAIGVQPRTGIDVFDFLRSRLLESLLWRQRLPVAGQATPFTEVELQNRYASVLGQLTDELNKLLSHSRLTSQLIQHLRTSDSGQEAGTEGSKDSKG